MNQPQKQEESIYFNTNLIYKLMCMDKAEKDISFHVKKCNGKPVLNIKKIASFRLH